MDFRQIEAFVNVVKYKSFSRAADALYLTQPTISTHISSLEKELGVQLIDRTGKEASPTRDGKELFPYAMELINTRDHAVNALQPKTQEIEGILEIQASSVPGEYIVPSLLSGFQKIHPQVRFYLEQSDTGQVERNLLENKGEIGFLGDRGTKDLNYVKLVTDQMVLVTPKNEKFLAIKGEEVTIDTMIKEPFLWREQGSATRKEFEERLVSLGKDPREIKAVALMNSLEAILQSVSCGMGVSVVPRLAVEGNRNYLMFQIQDMDLNRDFYLVWKKGGILSAKAEAFRDYVVSFYNAT